MEMVLSRIEHGQGRPDDLALLASLPARISMRTLCALGDAACGPVESAIGKFFPEFEHHILHKTCMCGGHQLLAELAAH
jgi:NADH-quinone oxidoreductase subunit F